MSLRNGLIHGAKNLIAGTLIAGSIYSSGNPSRIEYQAVNHTCSANTSQAIMLTPDQYIDLRMMSRDTVDMSNEGWTAINNPYFHKSLDLPWDGGRLAIESWIENGIQKPTEYVPALPPYGAAIFHHEILSIPELYKYITPWELASSPRDAGRMLYKAHDVKMIVENFLKSAEFQMLHEFLTSKGLSPEYDIAEYVSGVIEHNIEGAHAAVAPFSEQLPEGPKTFYLPKDFGEKSREAAKHYGISMRNGIVNTMMHEMLHLYGVPGTPRGEEMLENYLVEFCDTILSNYKGTTTPTGYGRDDVLNRNWKNFSEIRTISKDRAGRVKEEYGKRGINTLENLIGMLEKKGMAKADIEEIVSEYISKYDGKSAKTEYRTETKFEESGKESTKENTSENTYRENSESTDNNTEGGNAEAGEGGDSSE